jgi:hypothetical protein
MCFSNSTLDGGCEKLNVKIPYVTRGAVVGGIPPPPSHPVKYVQEGAQAIEVFFTHVSRARYWMLTTSVTKSPKNVGAGYNPPE